MAKKKKVILLNVPLLKGDVTQSGAVSLAMSLKYIKRNFDIDKNDYLQLIVDSTKGGMIYASRHGIAYAATTRGVRAKIYSNINDEGFAKIYAAQLGKNLDILHHSYEEVKKLLKKYKVREEKRRYSYNLIIKSIEKNRVPLVLVNGKLVNITKEEAPVWVVVSGFDEKNFFINDPVNEKIRQVPKEIFSKACLFNNEFHYVELFK